ncbi:hypothetical protein APR12_000215 [Nocardia amikacinitolerans]|nr:hypothetical protein [Nocardia amikacinitolerans]
MPSARRFDELSRHPAYPMIRSLVGRYVRECIADPRATQKNRWSVCALPITNRTKGNRRLLTVSCGPQEVLYVREVIGPDGAVRIAVACNIAPPSDRPASALTFVGENVTGGPSSEYRRTVWTWQFDLVSDVAELRGPISTTEFETLARSLTVELMESNTPYGRHHNANFAEDLLSDLTGQRSEMRN